MVGGRARPGDGGNWTRHEENCLADYIADGLSFRAAARRLMRTEAQARARFAKIAARLGEEAEAN